MYAEELAKAVRQDFKPNIIKEWDCQYQNLNTQTLHIIHFFYHIILSNDCINYVFY